MLRPVVRPQRVLQVLPPARPVHRQALHRRVAHAPCPPVVASFHHLLVAVAFRRRPLVARLVMLAGHAPLVRLALVQPAAWVAFLPPVSVAPHRVQRVRVHVPALQVLLAQAVVAVRVWVDKSVARRVVAPMLVAVEIVVVRAKKLANKNARTWSSCNHCNLRNTQRATPRFLRAPSWSNAARRRKSSHRNLIVVQST